MHSQSSLSERYISSLNPNSFVFFSILLILFIFTSLFFHPFHTFAPSREPLSTVELESNVKSGANRELLVRLEEAIETNAFRAVFTISRLHMRQFLKWIIFSKMVPAKNIAGVMRTKASSCLKPLKLTMFASIADSSFHGIGTG